MSDSKEQDEENVMDSIGVQETKEQNEDNVMEYSISTCTLPNEPHIINYEILIEGRVIKNKR